MSRRTRWRRLLPRELLAYGLMSMILAPVSFVAMLMTMEPFWLVTAIASVGIWCRSIIVTWRIEAYDEMEANWSVWTPQNGGDSHDPS